MSYQSRKRRLRNKLHIYRWRCRDLWAAIRIFLLSVGLAVLAMTGSGVLAVALGSAEILHAGSVAYWTIALYGIYLSFRPAFAGLAADFLTLRSEAHRSWRVGQRYSRRKLR
jgi:hypothetical protein